jgi:hypothetical protein
MRMKLFLDRLTKEIAECKAHAQACALRAEAAFDHQSRAYFIRLEKNWLSLARNFRFLQMFLKLVEDDNRNRRKRQDQ